MAKIEDNITGPGKLLSKARKKAGISEATIAEQLNLSIAVIKQLESDNYKGDIPDAFIRGYLRTFARAVVQDEDEVIALYSQVIGSTIVSNHFVPSNDVPPGNANNNNLLWFIIPGIAILIAIFIFVWLVLQNDNPENTTDINSTPKTDINTEVSDANLNSSTVTAAEVEAQNNTSDSQESLLEDSTDADNLQEITQQSPANDETSNIPSGFIESPVLSDAELEFSFIDDCWVQVIDSNEEVLAVGLKAAGRRFTVNGVPPIQVVLGKPRAVNIQFNHESVDLSIYPASQIARFSLSKEILE